MTRPLTGTFALECLLFAVLWLNLGPQRTPYNTREVTHDTPRGVFF